MTTPAVRPQDEAHPDAEPTGTLFGSRIVERLSVGPPSRRERIIHTLDGVEDPVTTAALHETGARLWQMAREQIPALTGGIDFILGLDAGGIIPTLGIAHAASLPYKIAWKLHLPLAGAIRFSEPHANRTDVHAYQISAGQRILIVDDEVTTGHTLANLARELRAVRAVPLAALCLVEDPRHGARDLLTRSAGLPLVSLQTLRTGQP